MWRYDIPTCKDIDDFTDIRFVSWTDHFTVLGLVTWPLNGSEAGGDLVSIQTSLLLLCKSSCSYANWLAFTWEKQRGLYQSKVTSSLTCIHGRVTKHTTVKWPIVLKFVGVSSKHLRIFLESLRKSLEVFGTSSEILRKCSRTLVWPSEQIWKIFENLRKVVGNLRKIIKNAVISIFI